MKLRNSCIALLGLLCLSSLLSPVAAQCDESKGCLSQFKALSMMDRDPNIRVTSLDYKIVMLYKDKIIYFQAEKKFSSEADPDPDSIDFLKAFENSRLQTPCDNQVCLAVEYEKMYGVKVPQGIKDILKDEAGAKCIVLSEEVAADQDNMFTCFPTVEMARDKRAEITGAILGSRAAAEKDMEKMDPEKRAEALEARKNKPAFEGPLAHTAYGTNVLTPEWVSLYRNKLAGFGEKHVASTFDFAIRYATIESDRIKTLEEENLDLPWAGSAAQKPNRKCCFVIKADKVNHWSFFCAINDQNGRKLQDCEATTRAWLTMLNKLISEDRTNEAMKSVMSKSNVRTDSAEFQTLMTSVKEAAQKAEEECKARQKNDPTVTDQQCEVFVADAVATKAVTIAKASPHIAQALLAKVKAEESEKKEAIAKAEKAGGAEAAKAAAAAIAAGASPALAAQMATSPDAMQAVALQANAKLAAQAAKNDPNAALAALAAAVQAEGAIAKEQAKELAKQNPNPQGSPYGQTNQPGSQKPSPVVQNPEQVLDRKQMAAALAASQIKGSTMENNPYPEDNMPSLENLLKAQKTLQEIIKGGKSEDTNPDKHCDKPEKKKEAALMPLITKDGDDMYLPFLQNVLQMNYKLPKDKQQ
eukprot:GILI01001161.1.p1 GENE.GILI01001161.1~~GILI01001161.1.p1  ORF type:complete len:642 (-),score=278.25 GILI01001161.1:446-2371(-)